MPASRSSSWRVITTDGCPTSSFIVSRQAVATPRGAFFREEPDGTGASHGRSIATVAAWRFDRGEGVEIEIDNGLQGRGSVSVGVAEAIGQGVALGGEFGVQGEQAGDGVAPALGSGATVGWPAVPDHRFRVGVLLARAMACLAFGVRRC